MRYRREQQYQELNRKQNEDDCSWNSVIVWGICISVIILVILYVSFGPSLYHPPPMLVGSETVSALDPDKKSIPVFENTINIDGVGNIFYRYTEPRGRGAHRQPDVLLLHGAKYGSAAWKGLGTLQILSYWGYKTIALDLPGYKLSKKATPPGPGNDEYITFIQNIIDKLRLSKVVVIAPSMSGIYGLPVLLEDNDIDLRGFIAIAPKSTNKYSKQQYQSVDVPVLVMYGERDKTPYKEESLYWMDNIPYHSNVMIAKAEHAAFVGNPEDFHKEILRFLSTECNVGVDTETDDTDLQQVYDDNDDLFGYDTNTDTDTQYYADMDTVNDKDSNFEEYLAQYFAGDGDDGDYTDDYYDDTDLYFDNKDLIDEPTDDDSYKGMDDLDDIETDTQDPDLGDDGDGDDQI